MSWMCIWRQQSDMDIFLPAVGLLLCHHWWPHWCLCSQLWCKSRQLSRNPFFLNRMGIIMPLVSQDVAARTPINSILLQQVVFCILPKLALKPCLRVPFKIKNCVCAFKRLTQWIYFCEYVKTVLENVSKLSWLNCHIVQIMVSHSPKKCHKTPQTHTSFKT